MIFYHISTRLQHSGDFEPRIPDCRHKQAEDSSTPRVSVAPTIEDCLTAIPGGGTHMEDLNIESRGYYLVFKIDTEKLNIPETNIVTSEDLYEKDLVRDADITNEYWITCGFKVSKEDRFIINLENWNEESYDVFPHSIYDVADEEYEGDVHEAYREMYEENVPCTVGIIDLEYTTEDVKEGEKVRIYYNCDDDERDELIEYLNKHYDVEIEDNEMDEFYLTAKTDINLRSFYIYHHRIIDLL